jgi:hypothetical protein
MGLVLPFLLFFFFLKYIADDVLFACSEHNYHSDAWKISGCFFTKRIKTSTYLYPINTFGTLKNQFINKQKRPKKNQKTQSK